MTHLGQRRVLNACTLYGLKIESHYLKCFPVLEVYEVLTVQPTVSRVILG